MELKRGMWIVTMVMLALGCVGPKGDKGDPGPEGPQGVAGPAGSPDTPAQVLDKLDQAIAGGGSLALQRSAVSAVVAASFNVSSATFVKVPYASAVYDKLGEFNPAAARFTAVHSGEYQVCAWLYTTATFTPWELDLYINGIRERGFAYGNSDLIAGGCRPTHLNASDYLEVWVWQNSGTTQSFVPNGYWSWLSIHRID